MSKRPIQRDPILTEGGITSRVYVVTRWRDLGGGLIEAVEKHDVTDQFEALAAQRGDQPTTANAGSASGGDAA
jgi:hypothetical protein